MINFAGYFVLIATIVGIYYLFLRTEWGRSPKVQFLEQLKYHRENNTESEYLEEVLAQKVKVSKPINLGQFLNTDRSKAMDIIVAASAIFSTVVLLWFCIRTYESQAFWDHLISRNLTPGLDLQDVVIPFVVGILVSSSTLLYRVQGINKQKLELVEQLKQALDGNKLEFYIAHLNQEAKSSWVK